MLKLGAIRKLVPQRAAKFLYARDFVIPVILFCIFQQQKLRAPYF